MNAAILQFQFYNSSIKTFISISLLATEINFNSTIVRLKLSICINATSYISIFQFYNSSIKTPVRNDEFLLKTSFQFYNSSIKTLRHPATHDNLPDFNSTIVRLKRNKIPDMSIIDTYFNSTIVRLKQMTINSKNIAKTHFNSTIVRLKLRWYGYGESELLNFNSTIVRLKLCMFF